jgi:hypothetical protein
MVPLAIVEPRIGIAFTDHPVSELTYLIGPIQHFTIENTISVGQTSSYVDV